ERSLAELTELTADLPDCGSYTSELLLEYGQRELANLRPCELSDFECEQTLSTEVEVVAAPDGMDLPRVCEEFDGVCGRCALRVCGDSLRACCGDADCVAAFSAYDACLEDTWDDTIQSYPAAQQTCRDQE